MFRNGSRRTVPFSATISLVEDLSTDMDPAPEMNGLQPDMPITLVRDPDYYWSDGGSCVIIQVKDSLFRIHTYLLERDSIFFRKLFTLPQAQVQDEDHAREGREGKSDGNPIICHDSLEEFQALCWILYARPTETSAQQNWETGDLVRLVDIMVISQKYEFQDSLDWALDVMDIHSRRNPDQFIDSCGGWKNMNKILDICNLTQHHALSERIQQIWLDRINVSHAEKSVEAFQAALKTAEVSPYLRHFHGKAYYMYLKATGSFKPSTGRSASPPEMGDLARYVDYSPFKPGLLSNEQTVRLCHELLSLMRLRPRLSQAPRLEADPGCQQKHVRNCTPQWGMNWSGEEKRAESDPREFLLLQQYTFTSSPITRFPCIGRAQSEMKTMIETFDENLPNHFMIPT